MAKVKKEGDKAHLEIENLKAMLARALADYDNLSKRVDREREIFSKVASIGIITKLLPVLDMFENAQRYLKDQGLAIAIGEFVNVLKDEGMSVINPNVGDEFDENTMEAIEVTDGLQDNMISEVVLGGWKFNDGRVIRHAKVKVSKINN